MADMVELPGSALVELPGSALLELVLQLGDRLNRMRAELEHEKAERQRWANRACRAELTLKRLRLKTGVSKPKRKAK